MWLFTPQGFYSVVAHRRDPDKLLVRARVRADLEALREQIPDLRIFSDRSADYRWRAVVRRAEWVAALRRPPRARRTRRGRSNAPPQHFPKTYRPPSGLSFSASEALFPPAELRAQVEPDYEAERERRFPGPYPSFDDVLGRLEGLEELL